MHTFIVGLQPMANRKNLLLSFLLFAFLLGSAVAEAQKTYFVYLQSDNQQPFYINIRGKNVSSSAIGYVILPKLVDSTYPIKIGFNSGVPVQEFDLVVNGNDQGFIIKDFGEKGFGLFNLQSLTVQMNINGAGKQKEELAREEKRVKDSLAAEALVLAEKQKADSIKLASEQEAKKKAEDSAALAKTGDGKSSTGAGIAVAGATVAGTAIKTTGETAGAGSEAGSKTAVPAVVAVPVVTDISKSPDSAKKEIVSIDSSIAKDSTASMVTDTIATIAKDTMGMAKAVDSVAVVNKEEKPLVADSSSIVKGSVSPTPVGAIVTGAAVAGGAAVVKTADAGKPNFLDMELGGDSTHTDAKATVKDTAKPEMVMVDSTIKDSARTDTIASKNTRDTTVIAGIQTMPEKSSATGSITMNTPNTSVVAPVAVASAGAAVVSDKAAAVTNTSCKKIAGEKDFYSLRKKMVASDDAAQMILTAKTVFKEKCFSNEQLRNLCVLFLDDASRYRFLDEAYPYTTDPQSYKQLGDLLKDEYYNRRFMAMLK